MVAFSTNHAALRPERAAWLVEKATELGATAIHFFRSEHTPRNYGEGNLERWRRMAVAAVEQCHRATCPEISGVESWQNLLDAAGHHIDEDDHDVLVLDAAGTIVESNEDDLRRRKRKKTTRKKNRR